MTPMFNLRECFGFLRYNMDALHQHNANACQIIRNYPAIFERARQSITRSDQACVKVHGGPYEHL
jgi:hypothetical protein